MAEFDEPISDRELDVLSCLAEGASNREIAQQLSISPNTVKVHLRNIYTKLGVSSRTEATTVALQKGVLSIPGIEVETAEREGKAGARAVDEGDADEPPAVTVTGTGEDVEADAGPVAPVVPEAPVIVTETGEEGASIASPPRSRRPLLLIGAVALIAFLLAGAALVRVWMDAGETAATPAPAVEAPAATEDAAITEVELGANWRQGLSSGEPRAGMAVHNVGLNIYQIGGEADEGVVGTVSIYDTQSRRWLQGQPKITPVADVASAVLGGEIYLIGGRLENGQATAVVEAYSPLNDGWRPVASLPRPVTGAVAVASSDALYLFGGRRGEEVLAESYRFDPVGGQWEPLPSLAQARVFASAGLIDGQPHVVGGYDGREALASCERFDPLSASWSACPGMQHPRQGAAAALVLNKLYVIGGSTETGEGAFGEVYSPEGGTEGAWTPMERPTEVDLPAWTYLGATNVETRIYALGGLRDGERVDDLLIYSPLVYRFFIPAASASDE